MRVVGVSGRERFVGESEVAWGLGEFFFVGVGGWFVGEIFPLKMP